LDSFKTGYNRIPINPIISISHIVTSYKNKTIYKSNIAEYHDFWELQLVRKGTVYNSVLDGSLIPLYENELLIIAPNVFHGCDDASIGSNIGIISFECKSEILKILGNKKIPLSPYETREFEEIIQICFNYMSYENNCNLLRENVQQFELQIIKNRLELFLVNILKNNNYITAISSNDKNKVYDKLSTEVVRYFEEHISDSLTLNDISNTFFVSESLIKKVFKKKFNSGVIDYFIDLKISVAKNLIANSDVKMAEISEQLGFSSAYYFSRVFKAKTGMTPSQYAFTVK